MKKATFIKLLCLAIACCMLLPMVIACGEESKSDKGGDGAGDTTATTAGGSTGTTAGGTTSTNPGTTDSTQGGGNQDVTGETVTIVFRVNGGTIVNGANSVKIAKGGVLTIDKIPELTRNGYTFAYWSYTANGNDEIKSDDVFVVDTILFAIWTENSSGTVDTSNNGNTTDTSNNTTNSTNNTQNPPAPSKVGIGFDGNGGSVVFDYIEIDYGSKLAYSSIPSATRAGYTLKGWAYDPWGNEMWSARNDVFTEETELFAIWEKESSGGSTTDSTQGGNQGGTDDPVVPSGKVTIEFNTGTGYFEDANDYEMELDKGGRIPSFPTPVHDNEAMVFEGWYEDAACTVAASRSKKYDADAMLYAKWTEMVECSDGSYDHVWGSWDMDTKPDCKNAGKDARYCTICGNKQFKDGDPALGHLWNSWEEAFMRRERSCGRLGCTEKEIINYQDVTIAVLGNTPGSQVEGSTDKFYVVPFTNLINGRWDEGFGEFVGPKGNGAAHVQFNLIEATTLDRIYFKGEGVTSINVFVQYEGESDFALVGVCSSAPDRESAPFVTPDATKKIVAIKFVEDNPPNGTSKWQEVAFVKVAAAE